MKIMHIISGGDKGGAKTHMFALLDELCKMADVTVVCLMRGVFYEEIIQKKNIRTLLIEQKGRMDFSVCKTITRIVKEEGFDIINAHGARANFIAMLLNKKKLNIPIVTTVHSDYLLDFDSFLKKLIFTNLNRIALRKIKYKIAVSDSFRDMLISRGFSPNDILTVYNGISFENQAEPISKEDFARKFNIPYDKSKTYIGIAARFNRVKGVDIFLRSAAHLLSQTDNARFVIAGEGEDKDELVELARSLGIADKVYFIGFVSEIFDFLNFIDINMLTSLSESFPYSLLEGAKAKKATVASAVGGIPHLIIDGETGYLFNSTDHIECANKLLLLINNPEKIQELGNNLYNKAFREFSNKALAENYLSNYESFIRKYRRKKRYDVIISGYYGYGNFGDDIVMSTLISKLKNRDPDIEILALTRNPQAAMLNFGIDCKNRYNILKFNRLFSQSSNYINGGGTLFTDITSKRSLSYYSFMLRLAKKKGLTTMIIANGIGPFIHKSSLKKAKKAIACADVITLRDNHSYELIKSMGLENASVTADMALLYTPGERILREAEKILSQNKVGEKYFVVSIREWRHSVSDFEKIIASGCDYLASKYGLTPVFIPVQFEKDIDTSMRTICEMKSESVLLTNVGDATEIFAGIIYGAELTLSMRLHPLVFSYSSGIPLLALSYDEKVSSFIKENNAGESIETSEITEDALIAAIDKVKSLSDNAEESKERLLMLKNKAEKNIDIIFKNLKK